jgi:hypothetical protein
MLLVVLLCAPHFDGSGTSSSRRWRDRPRLCHALHSPTTKSRAAAIAHTAALTPTGSGVRPSNITCVIGSLSQKFCLRRKGATQSLFPITHVILNEPRKKKNLSPPTHWKNKALLLKPPTSNLKTGYFFQLKKKNQLFLRS